MLLEWVCLFCYFVSISVSLSDKFDLAELSKNWLQSEPIYICIYMYIRVYIYIDIDRYLL